MSDVTQARSSNGEVAAALERITVWLLFTNTVRGSGPRRGHQRQASSEQIATRRGRTVFGQRSWLACKRGDGHDRLSPELQFFFQRHEDANESWHAGGPVTGALKRESAQAWTQMRGAGHRFFDMGPASYDAVSTAFHGVAQGR